MRVLAHKQRAGGAVAFRYSQIAWVMARMCCSVNVVFDGVPAMAAGAEADQLSWIRECRACS